MKKTLGPTVLAMIPPNRLSRCWWPECEKGKVTTRLRSEILSVTQDDAGYTLQLNGDVVAVDKPGYCQRRPVDAGPGGDAIRL
ncbi:Uncharacterised protein [Kluyvera cryocrescens]|uniref:Uncharacterized protein n=1 Tax=Kluyvera cryocrescens TaxID=580 RepID=A0A485AQH1_KLUCR|nr:Uncharacterised protein [Kluyvera cryocrescens]